MSQNEKLNQQEQQILTDLFAKVNKTQIEPSPYLKTRVLAHVKEAQNHQKTLRFWKFLSASSFAVMLLIGVYTYKAFNLNENNAITNQAYVIHVDFNQEDLSKVAKAEITLPDDVNFMSAKGKLSTLRSLTLPITVKNLGRSKLPFVVSSAVDGEKNIQIRLLDLNNNLIREQNLKFKFAKTNQQVSL